MRRDRGDAGVAPRPFGSGQAAAVSAGLPGVAAGGGVGFGGGVFVRGEGGGGGAGLKGWAGAEGTHPAEPQADDRREHSPYSAISPPGSRFFNRSSRSFA